MTAEVGWGLLGTAQINRRLVPAIHAAGRSRLVAIASRERVRAEAAARECSAAHAVEGYQALLDRNDVTAVYIPLPNSLHVEWTLAAIAAGKHVLCEKPFVLDPADIARIASARTAAGVVVEEGLMYRHEPLTARVVDLVANGAVGAVRTIVSGFTFARSRNGDVRLDPSLGGGALWDVGCYPVSYACLLTGRDHVSAFGIAHQAATGVDEELTGGLSFRGGITASVYAGFRAPYRTWLDVVGTEGALSVPMPFRPGPVETLTLTRAGDVQSIEVHGSRLLFKRQVEVFVAAVLDGTPTVVSLDESRRCAAAICALHRSARAGVTS